MDPSPPSAVDPLDAALAAVGDRWTLLAIAALLDGPERFNALQERLPGIAATVLADRLRRLERARLVLAQPYTERPPRFVYELTASGRELAGALRLLADWGARHGAGVVADDDSPLRHAACGTALEARWWCPTCEQTVADADGEDVHFA